jgi:hypothetical protein
MTDDTTLTLLAAHPLTLAGHEQRYLKAATSDNTRKAY